MIYETNSDRERERAFMRDLEKRLNCKMLKLPYHWQIDCIAARKDYHRELWATAYCELKCRNIGSKDYPTIVLTEKKALTGIKLATHAGIPFSFFVRFKDGDKFVNLSSLKGFRRELWKARNHAHDPKDTKVVVHIPIELFRGL